MMEWTTGFIRPAYFPEADIAGYHIHDIISGYHLIYNFI